VALNANPDKKIVRKACKFLTLKKIISVFCDYIVTYIKKRLKEQSETVYRRRTLKHNTMAKRKSTKGQTTIDKTYIKN